MTNTSHVETQAYREKPFRWGMILTWTPFVLIAIPSVIHATARSLYKQSGFGLGAVAWLPPHVIGATGAVVIAVEISALVLLTRAISKDAPMRSAIAIMTMCCSALMITMTALYLWLIFVGLPRFGA